MSGRRHTPEPGTTPVLRVVTDDGRRFRFAQAFHAGRGKDCEVRIDHGEVSRHHLEVVFEDGSWAVRDLASGNGIFVDGERVSAVEVKKPGAFHGFIQFAFAGATPHDRGHTLTGGAFDAARDENSVTFAGADEYDMALKIKLFVESWSPATPHPSGEHDRS